MEGWDFKFCMCVYNEVQQRSSNGHLPILGSFWEKWQKLHKEQIIGKLGLMLRSHPAWVLKIRTHLYLFYELLKFYSKELVSGLSEFFRKKSTFFFGHMIHQNSLEFPQDYEYAIQKILRSLVLELLPKNGN